MKKITVLGSTNIDFVINVSHTPVAGETLMGGSFEKISGGKGANQAVACGKLGGDTTFLSCVGQDGFGESLIESLTAANVNTCHIKKAENVETGMAVIYVNREGNNSIVVVAGANNCCDKKYVIEKQKVIEECHILLVQLEVPSEGVYYAMKKAKEAGKLVILNPAPAPDFIPDEVYQNLDFITPNETELEKLSGIPVDGIDGAKKACLVLLEKGAKNVLVTLGSNGAMLANKHGCTHYPTAKVAVVDTTAAGDTFNGAFAVYLAEGHGVEDAIVFANRASSLAVSKKGAQSSIPFRKELA